MRCCNIDVTAVVRVFIGNESNGGFLVVFRERTRTVLAYRACPFNCEQSESPSRTTPCCRGF